MHFTLHKLLWERTEQAETQGCVTGNGGKNSIAQRGTLAPEGKWPGNSTTIRTVCACARLGGTKDWTLNTPCLHLPLKHAMHISSTAVARRQLNCYKTLCFLHIFQKDTNCTRSSVVYLWCFAPEITAWCYIFRLEFVTLWQNDGYFGYFNILHCTEKWFF